MSDKKPLVFWRCFCGLDVCKCQRTPFKPMYYPVINLITGKEESMLIGGGYARSDPKDW